MGDLEVAIAEGRYLDAVRPWEIAELAPPEGASRKGYTGILYHAAGDEPRARQLFLAAQRQAPRNFHDPEGIEGLAISQSMLGEHAAALATIDELRAKLPESRDAINGPEVSFMRCVILVRAGRSEEAYAEVNRLLHVPFGNPLWKYGEVHLVALLVKDDPHFDELLYHPPRL